MPLIIENQEFYSQQKGLFGYYWPNDTSEQNNQIYKQWYNQKLLYLLQGSMVTHPFQKGSQKLLHFCRQALTTSTKPTLCTLIEESVSEWLETLFLGLILD